MFKKMRGRERAMWAAIAITLVSCASNQNEVSSVCEIASAKEAPEGVIDLHGDLLAMRDFVFFLPDEDCHFPRTLWVESLPVVLENGSSLLQRLTSQFQSSDATRYGAISGTFEISLRHDALLPSARLATISKAAELEDVYVDRVWVERLVQRAIN